MNTVNTLIIILAFIGAMYVFPKLLLNPKEPRKAKAVTRDRRRLTKVHKGKPQPVETDAILLSRAIRLLMQEHEKEVLANRAGARPNK